MADEAEYLLRHSSNSERPNVDAMKSTTLGRVRAYWLGSVICMGGLLFGYDSGIVGKVQTIFMIVVW